MKSQIQFPQVRVPDDFNTVLELWEQGRTGMRTVRSATKQERSSIRIQKSFLVSKTIAINTWWF